MSEITGSEPMRTGRCERQTGETRVAAAVALPAGSGTGPTAPAAPPESGLEGALPAPGEPPRIDVPDGFFAHMLDALAVHGRLGLAVFARGDTEVDLHHTVEDVGIALGEALAAALGERRGVRRFATAYAPLDEALVRAVVDLSGRGFFAYRAEGEVDRLWATRGFPVTLAADFFGALADRSRTTLHLDLLAGRSGHHVVEAAFKAVALALRQAVTPAAAGSEAVPSTKGTLDR